MEDTLRESYATALKAVGSVLILVLMEDTLRGKKYAIIKIKNKNNKSVNPR